MVVSGCSHPMTKSGLQTIRVYKIRLIDGLSPRYPTD
jgi:hypothetical protein